MESNPWIKLKNAQESAVAYLKVNFIPFYEAQTSDSINALSMSLTVPQFPVDQEGQTIMSMLILASKDVWTAGNPPNIGAVLAYRDPKSDSSPPGPKWTIWVTKEVTPPGPRVDVNPGDVLTLSWKKQPAANSGFEWLFEVKKGSNALLSDTIKGVDMRYIFAPGLMASGLVDNCNGLPSDRQILARNVDVELAATTYNGSGWKLYAGYHDEVGCNSFEIVTPDKVKGTVGMKW